MMDKELIRFGAKCELARREFFFYCNLKAPDFYKSDRKYLVELCNAFQEFYYSNNDVLIVNAPPRHGKSRTASLFIEWVLGMNPKEKIMTGSYNETLSTNFSKSVRNGIMETKADKLKPVFSDIFPGVSIKRGDGAMNLWSLEGGYNNYLATSPTGTATGFGANLMIIDDLIKNAVEANNENTLDAHWDWFSNTMLSRLEEGGKIIVIMTRWHSQDLAGKVIEWCKDEDKKYTHISMRALVDADKKLMLCSDILSYDSYLTKVSAMGEDIASANYQQEPIDLKGKLYPSFSTYEELPKDILMILAYTDTADEGDDNLCTTIAAVDSKCEGYMLDVYYTKAEMEVTEEELPYIIYKNNVDYALFESNNGGKGFARVIKRKLEDMNAKTVVSWFHQSQNKLARILTNSTYVMNKIHMPADWAKRWPDYYKDMNKYQRSKKNKHDDAPDATTGLGELIQAYANNNLDDYKTKKSTTRERREVKRR